MQRKTKKPRANINTLTPMRFGKPTEQPCFNRSSQKKSRLQQSQTHNATATAHTGPKRTDGPQTPAYMEAAAESIQRSRSPTPQALLPQSTTPHHTSNTNPPPPPRVRLKPGLFGSWHSGFCYLIKNKERQLPNKPYVGFWVERPGI